MRLQLEIDERDESANPLATFKFGPLFYERHCVTSSASTTTICTAGLRYTRGLCDPEFRIIRGESALGQGTGTRVQH